MVYLKKNEFLYVCNYRFMSTLHILDHKNYEYYGSTDFYVTSTDYRPEIYNYEFDCVIYDSSFYEHSMLLDQITHGNVNVLFIKNSFPNFYRSFDTYVLHIENIRNMDKLLNYEIKTKELVIDKCIISDNFNKISVSDRLIIKNCLCNEIFAMYKKIKYLEFENCVISKFMLRNFKNLDVLVIYHKSYVEIRKLYKIFEIIKPQKIILKYEEPFILNISWLYELVKIENGVFTYILKF